MVISWFLSAIFDWPPRSPTPKYQNNRPKSFKIMLAAACQGKLEGSP